MKRITHGGKRQGAGRKAKVKKYISVGIYEETYKSFTIGKKSQNNTELVNNAITYYVDNSDLFKR